MLVDRPDPFDFEYRGVIATIDFKWGADIEQFPKGVAISIQFKSNPVALLEMANYSSVEEAKHRGVQLVIVEIDKLLGPDPDVDLS